MRNQPNSRLKAWMFAPLLVVACGQEGAGGTPEFVTIPSALVPTRCSAPTLRAGSSASRCLRARPPCRTARSTASR